MTIEDFSTNDDKVSREEQACQPSDPYARRRMWCRRVEANERAIHTYDARIADLQRQVDEMRREPPEPPTRWHAINGYWRTAWRLERDRECRGCTR